MKKLMLLICGVCLAVACHTAPKIENAESDAEVLYKTGIYYLQNENYEESEKTFMKVITDFSFSKWEPYATIGLGDTYFGKEEYLSALEVYKRFLTMRPNHEKADYAAFQLGNCYFEQRPSSFVILPDPEEKDLAVVEKAAEQYREYIKNYPKGTHLEEVQKKLAQAEEMLISRELKVAEFYLKTGKCESVKMRLKYIADHFTVSTEPAMVRIKKLDSSCK